MTSTRSPMSDDDLEAIDYLLDKRADEIPLRARAFLVGLSERQPASITQTQREWVDDL